MIDDKTIFASIDSYFVIVVRNENKMQGYITDNRPAWRLTSDIYKAQSFKTIVRAEAAAEHFLKDAEKIGKSGYELYVAEIQCNIIKIKTIK